MKRKVKLFLSVFVILFTFLPGYNFWQHAKNYDHKKLFNTDILESYFNYGIYKIFNKSAVPSKVITGRDGFTFAGDNLNNILSKFRNITIPDNKKIDDFVDYMYKMQKKYELLNIKVIYVIAPNKQSIYMEYLPLWISQGDKIFTDALVEKLEQKNIQILSLQESLLNAKKEGGQLYHKQDTHWNNYGGAIAYNAIINYLNKIHDLKIKKPKYTFSSSLSKSVYYKDEIKWLKIRILVTDYEVQLEKNCKMKQCNVDKENGEVNNCTLSENIRSELFFKEKYVYSDCAENDYKVLVIGDSFFDAMSILFQASFKETGQLYFKDFHGEKLQEFIKKNKPDIIIYQVTERFWPEEIKF